MENNKDKGGAELITLGLGSLIAGISGYFVGKGKYIKWDKFIKKFDERLNHLTYFKVIIPVVSLNATKQWQIYREGINAYLFGLPNASIPLISKCLEIGLKSKYEEIEMKKGDSMTLYNLIEWAKSYLRDKREIAHGFRILRNIIHEKIVVEEQDALECIRHISAILNLVYAFPVVCLNWKCGFCGKKYTTKIIKDSYHIGNTVDMRCDSCQQLSRQTVF